MIPGLATDCTEAEAAMMVTSDAYAAQEKLDGKRLMIGTSASARLILLNRNGEPTTVPAGTVLPTLPPNTWLDTEFMHATRQACVLDLLAWDGLDLTQRPMIERHRMAASLVPKMGNVSLVACAETLEDKARLIKRLREEQGEGLILKLAAAPHSPGRPNAGGSLRRVKWRKRMEVVLLRRTASDAKRSFEMFAYAGGQAVHVGSVSAHGFYPQLQPGTSTVAEVSYLMGSDDQKLLQPTIVRFRTDKAAAQCTLDQLVIGKRYLKGAA